MQTGDLQQISAWLAATDIEQLELSGPHGGYCLRREGAQVSVVANDAVAQDAGAAPLIIGASSVGIFLHGHPLRQEALVRAGERVRAGQVVALLKIGALLRPVVAPQAGVVVRTLAAHDTAVGFGTALFELSAS